MKYDLIHLSTVMNPDPKLGGLSFFEGTRDVPFEIKRFNCIFKAEQETHRKFRVNKTSNQLLFCPYGSVQVLLDDGIKKEKIILDEPQKGLIIYPNTCGELTWLKDDSTLCVAVSEYYDSNDNI